MFAAEITLNPIETDEGLLVSSAIRDVTDRRRADEATARLAAIVTSSPNAIISIGTDARIESWNAGAQQLYGHAAGEAIGQPITILNPPERSQNRSHVNAALAGETVTFESKDIRRDGTDVDTWVTISPIRDTEGGIIGVSCLAQDISERKRAEREGARLAAIVESSDEAIIGKTIDGQITSWNQGAERIYGYSAAEVTGKHISMLLPPARRRHRPDAGPRHPRRTRLAYRDDPPAKGRTTDRRLADCLPDQRLKRAVIGASTVARDITEHKLAERELQRLAEAAEHGSDAVISIDLDERVRHWNPGAERLGFPAEEAIGRTLAELTVFTEEPGDQIARIRAGEPAFQYETRRRRNDGTIIDVLLTISPWTDNGQLLGATGIAIDLSERKQAERAREQALRDLEEAQRLARIGSWTWDPSGEQLTWSAQMFDIYRRDPALGAPTRTRGVCLHPSR